MATIFDTFPKYYRNAITKCSPTGYICICTFWTKQEIVRQHISESNLEKVLTIGNLYTVEGLKFIILNAYLCPQIEYFIFVGADLNNVYKQIGKYTFPGYEEQCNKFWTTFMPRMFSIELDALNDGINDLTSTKTWWIPKPIIIDYSTPINNDALPSEETGFIVRDDNLERLWKRILTKVNMFGVTKRGSKDCYIKELIGVVSVLTDEAKVFEGMPNKEILEHYIPQVTTKNVTEGLSYTYGSRLYADDQIDSIVMKLLTEHYSKQAIAVTWQSSIDTTSKNPPCLVLVDCKIQNDKLYMTCYFRSHDAYGAYCMNIYALQQLQKNIIMQINCGQPDTNSAELSLGNLTIISNSCHIYDRDFDKCFNIRELDCNLDKRGYFIISTVDNMINVKFCSNDNKVQREFQSSSVHTLMDSCQPFISEISHALYMGKELHRAKQCIKNGSKYVQK